MTNSLRTCPRCLRDLPLTEEHWYFRKSGHAIGKLQGPACRNCRRERMKEWKQRHFGDDREALKAYLQERRLKQRLKVIEFLGGQCVRCGFSDWRALQVDHVRSDGAIERRSQPEIRGRFYGSILRGERPDLQLLCANCNWIKRYENNEHPYGKA